jgi:leucyl-tRNA synthetase
LADPEKLKYWMPVDWYNGGMEHVTRHMIYSRFWHKFLYDIGEVPTAEPYAKRTAQGLILGPDGDKMSKSKGNVVDPNEVVDAYGADVLRTYILFMGDYASAAPWSEAGVKGAKRFLDRFADVYDMVVDGASSSKLESAVHKTIRKVDGDIEEMKFNTAIAAMMGLLNEIYDEKKIGREDYKMLVRLICPFAPHLAEELWQMLGGEGLCALAAWPQYDEAKTVDTTVEVAVQVNGKLKGTIMLAKDADRDMALAAAKADARVAPLIDGKTIVKEIVVPGRIVNIVVR